MRTEKTNSAQYGAGQQLQQLLYFFELLNQVLQVKLETLFTLPLFLQTALDRVRSRRSTQQLSEVATCIQYHVKELHSIIVDLGGHIDQELLPFTRSEPKDILLTVSFQEGLSGQILNECLQVVQRGWRAAPLSRQVQERLQTILSETQEHSRIFDRLFANTQSRYRDLLVERFRVTALP